MATVYKIEIETVSEYVSYDERTIQEMFEEFLTENKLIHSDVKVIIKA